MLRKSVLAVMDTASVWLCIRAAPSEVTWFCPALAPVFTVDLRAMFFFFFFFLLKI